MQKVVFVVALALGWSVVILINFYKELLLIPKLSFSGNISIYLFIYILFAFVIIFICLIKSKKLSFTSSIYLFIYLQKKLYIFLLNPKSCLLAVILAFI